MKKCFTTINIVDFEYEVDDGDLPCVLCMVVYVLDCHLRHIRTIRLWRGDFGKTPPFDIGPDALFVAYSAWAELTCFMVLGWTFPAHVYDLHTAYLAASNILLPHEPDETRKRPRKRLSDACRAYGIEGWERIDKEAMAKDIGEGGGANTAVSVSWNIVKRMSKRQQSCCADSYEDSLGFQVPMFHMCCIGQITAPSRSH